jgi:ElaB/YqjD/DUF883 family membrane-anchored ribosome-binding protein
MNDTSKPAGAAADATADLAAPAREALYSGVQRARIAAGAAGEWASDVASETADAVSKASVRSYRTAEDTIRIYPVLSVSVALIAGFAIGALLVSRDR